MSATVKLNDKTFQLSIPHEQLIKAISRVGSQISHDCAEWSFYVHGRVDATHRSEL